MFRRSWSTFAVLVLAATAIVGCAPGPREITITIRHSAFEPQRITVPRNVPVTFVLVNEDPIDHEWLVGDAEFHALHRTGTHAAHGHAANEITIPALETATTTITFDEPGSVAFICHLPGHEAYGMVGVLTVEG
ncbi:MAG TPA: cupredoxin domain-containing protein [Candidatus Limnocylindrales bacterium]|jgi:uncharacterized cupredoxin-like copper-binding protein|nr:cupredoxin domain-containing protein [Candidatus Limnocylindrales bacterium]